MSSLSNEHNTDHIKYLMDKIDILTSLVMEQTLTINNQTATINKLTETISKQQEEISSLREQLNKSSKNSSKPPSSDGFNKPELKVFVNHQVKIKVPKKVIKAQAFQ